MYIIWTKHASRNSQRKIQNISRGIEKGRRKILDLKPFSFYFWKYLFKDRTTHMMMKSNGVKRCCSLCDLHAGFINPCSTNVPLLYPLKTSENRRFSYVFRGYRSGMLVENGLSLERKRPKYLNILVRQYMKLLPQKNISQIF